MNDSTRIQAGGSPVTPGTAADMAPEPALAAITPLALEAEAHNPQSLRTRLRRLALQTAARLAPRLTAGVVAQRYLSSGQAYMDDPTLSRYGFEVIELGPGSAILRQRAKSPNAPRVLIVPGHDGHYRQFTRLMRDLHRLGLTCDLLALPGHLHPDRTPCTLADIVDAIKRAFALEGPYDGVAAHCLSVAAVLTTLDEGLPCPRVAMISSVLDVGRLVAMGGKQYGLTGRCLAEFVAICDARSAPYPIDVAWRPMAAEREEQILLVHARNDYVAPIENAETFAALCPGARLAAYDDFGHNGILGSREAMGAVATFLSAGSRQTTRPGTGRDRPAPDGPPDKHADKKAGPSAEGPAVPH